MPDPKLVRADSACTDSMSSHRAGIQSSTRHGGRGIGSRCRQAHLRKCLAASVQRFPQQSKAGCMGSSHQTRPSRVTCILHTQGHYVPTQLQRAAARCLEIERVEELLESEEGQRSRFWRSSLCPMTDPHPCTEESSCASGFLQPDCQHLLDLVWLANLVARRLFCGGMYMDRGERPPPGSCIASRPAEGPRSGRAGPGRGQERPSLGSRGSASPVISELGPRSAWKLASKAMPESFKRTCTRPCRARPQPPSPLLMLLPSLPPGSSPKKSKLKT